MAELGVYTPICLYQRQKQSLSYASPLVVYWDPLQDHFWNGKVCHESLSQCQSYFGSSPKFKKFHFWGHYRPIRGSIIGFLALKPLPSESPRNSTQD